MRIQVHYNSSITLKQLSDWQEHNRYAKYRYFQYCKILYLCFNLKNKYIQKYVFKIIQFTIQFDLQIKYKYCIV